MGHSLGQDGGSYPRVLIWTKPSLSDGSEHYSSNRFETPSLILQVLAANTAIRQTVHFTPSVTPLYNLAPLCVSSVQSLKLSPSPGLLASRQPTHVLIGDVNADVNPRLVTSLYRQL